MYNKRYYMYMGSNDMVKFVRCGGGVGLRVLVCAVSLLALAGAIVALLQTFEMRKADDYRKAVLLSEYGLQEAFNKLRESSYQWDAGFANESYEDGTFSVAVTRESRGDTVYLKILSTGVMGSTTQTKECTLRLEVSEEDTVWVNEGIR